MCIQAPCLCLGARSIVHTDFPADACAGAPIRGRLLVSNERHIRVECVGDVPLVLLAVGGLVLWAVMR